MNKRAKFWMYTGNHSEGKNHERKDPHSFGLDLITAMAFWGDDGDYQSPLTYHDTKRIKVIHHKGNDFGHEVTVSAPNEIWEKGKQALELLNPSRRGRRKGFSPIRPIDGAMTKKNKAWSMPDSDWIWLESQTNQSKILREAIALYRQRSHTEQSPSVE